MKFFSLITSFLLIFGLCHAQEQPLPYTKLTDETQAYSAGTVAARVVDGLGFRFYWATEGLRTEDLNWKPSAGAWTSHEVLTHVYEMSFMILNAVQGKPNISNDNEPVVPFEEMRARTLHNLKQASDLLRKAKDEDFKNFRVIFQRGNNVSEYPFWNMLNGPIADCLWHVGQIVSHRRSSGNPIHEKVSVFHGKVRE